MDGPRYIRKPILFCRLGPNLGNRQLPATFGIVTKPPAQGTIHLNYRWSEPKGSDQVKRLLPLFATAHRDGVNLRELAGLLQIIYIVICDKIGKILAENVTKYA